MRVRKDIKQHYSDETLIARYKLDQNTEWIGILFERYTHLVFGVSMKYLKNEEEAKDAVMDIFEKLIDDLKIHEIKNFKSWLFSYTKNHCLMGIRKKKLDTVPAENYMNLVHDDLFSELVEKEKIEKKIEILKRFIDILPKEQKICIELFYLEDKSYKEVIELTGFDEKKVKSYIQNGKRRLKLNLDNKLND